MTREAWWWKDMDSRESEGIADFTKQTIDIHWPLFRESPTNTILLFLNLSSSAVALNLRPPFNYTTLKQA